MEKDTKVEVNIESGNSHLEGGMMRFTLSIRSDPQQHGKTLNFNYSAAQGLRDILDEYIQVIKRNSL